MAAVLKVAGVGAGYFSQFHYDSWTRMDRASLVGVCDRDLAKAEATGHPAFGDLAQMIEAVAPDVLDVIVPPAAQAEAVRAALALGVRRIICQKPFCRDLDEARAIVSEAKGMGAQLIVHENFRFQPWYRAIRAALDQGRLGEVHQASFRMRPGDGQGPRAYLDRQPYFQQMERFLVRETAVHWIDTYRYLFGDPVAVYADLRRLNPAISGEDAGYILFEHPGGIRALFDGNRHLDHVAENKRLTMGEGFVEGTGGTLRITGDGAVRFRAFGASDEDLVLAPEDWPGFGGDSVHAFQSHVVDGILDWSEIETLADSYLTVLGIEDAIYRSAAEGRKMEVAA
ncbi:MAG: Gfo/Idh/MocA family oxidoreductase [Silicimonas sp.]|nr:Gfo/Idh/MocA family oxidoreductase [Silicimonas sp.]